MLFCCIEQNTFECIEIYTYRLLLFARKDIFTNYYDSRIELNMVSQNEVVKNVFRRRVIHVLCIRKYVLQLSTGNRDRRREQPTKPDGRSVEETLNSPLRRLVYIDVGITIYDTTFMHLPQDVGYTTTRVILLSVIFLPVYEDNNSSNVKHTSFWNFYRFHVVLSYYKYVQKFFIFYFFFIMVMNNYIGFSFVHTTSVKIKTQKNLKL